MGGWFGGVEERGWVETGIIHRKVGVIGAWEGADIERGWVL